MDDIFPPPFTFLGDEDKNKIETIVYETDFGDINEWLRNIVIRENEEGKTFIVDFKNKGIKGDVVFNGRSELRCSHNKMNSLICLNVKKLKCSHNELIELICPNVIKLNCSYNRLVVLICHYVIDLKCHNNELKQLECPFVYILNCSCNHLVELYCPFVYILKCTNNSLTKLYCIIVNILICSDNHLSKLVCPFATYVDCSNNMLFFIVCNMIENLICTYNELEEVTCLDNTRVECDDSCNVIRSKVILPELPSPDLIEKGILYECDICRDEKQSKIACSFCKKCSCPDCFISIFELNKGHPKCPLCRFQVKYPINSTNLDYYVNSLKRKYLN